MAEERQKKMEKKQTLNWHKVLNHRVIRISVLSDLLIKQPVFSKGDSFGKCTIYSFKWTDFLLAKLINLEQNLEHMYSC